MSGLWPAGRLGFGLASLSTVLFVVAVASAPASAAGVPVASGNSAFPDLPNLLTADSDGMVWATLNAADQPTLWAQRLASGNTSGAPVQLTGGNFTRLTANGFVPGRNLSIAGTMVAAAGDSFTSFGTEQQRVSLYDLASATATNPIISGFGDGGGFNNQVFFASAAPDGMLFVALEAESEPHTVHVIDEDQARDAKVDLGALPDASTDPTLLANVRGATSPDGSVIAYPTTLTVGGKPQDNLAFVPYNGDGPTVLATGARGSFESSLVTGGGRVAWADYSRGANGGCVYDALPLDGSGNGTPTVYNPSNFCDQLDGISSTALALSPFPVVGGEAGDGIPCPVTMPNCAGGKLATIALAGGSLTQSSSVDALSAVTDGTSLYVSQGTTLGTTAGSAGIYSTTGANSPESLLTAAPARPLSGAEMALSPGRVTWSDDSTASYPLSTRTLRAEGSSLVLGTPQNVTTTTLPGSPFDGYGVSASGGRTAYALPPAGEGGPDRLVVRQPDGTTQTIVTYADGTPALRSGGDRVPVPGTVQVSGSNVLFLTADPGEGYDAHVYSTVTQTTRDFGPAAAFALSGGYLAWVANDGSVWRQDIVANSAPVLLRPATSQGAGQTLAIRAEIAAAGDYVGWLVRECITSAGGDTCSGNTEAGYRDAATMDPAQVVLTAPTTPPAGTAPATPQNIAMSDAYLLVDEVNTGFGTPGARTLVAVRLADGSTSSVTSPNQYVSGPGKFAADGSNVAWLDPGGAPQVEALDTTTDPPRVLTLDAPSSIPIGQRQRFEVVASAPLGSCTITIASAGTTVRTLDCAAPDGDGATTWDGTDSFGTAVAPGSYTWTITGANGGGPLLDYTGSNDPITGTVRVVAAPSLSLGAPASGEAGSPIAAAAIQSSLSGGASASGTVTFKVFGPQPSAPTDCSGGTTVGSATVSGDGAYSPSAGFTPVVAGRYWWYAIYGGDTDNAPASSPCGPSMLGMAVAAPPPAAGTGSAAARNAAGTPVPRLLGLQLKPRAFAVARKRAAAHGAGAWISYRDTLAAQTTFRVLRCAGRHGSCGRLAPVGKFTHHDRAGRNRVRFTGRLRRRALARGRYVLEASAALAGRTSRPVSVRFRII